MVRMSAERSVGSISPNTSTFATADPRAERTRRAILMAIGTLMAQRTAQVTVGDIVRVAGISRSSFYAHFSSLDELAAEYLRLQLVEISAEETSAPDAPEPDSGASAARRGYSSLMAHMADNYPLYSSVLELPLSRSVYDDIVQAYARRVVDSLVARRGVPASVDTDVATMYLAGGTLTLIRAWMSGLLDVSDDELVEQLVELLPVWLLEPPD